MAWYEEFDRKAAALLPLMPVLREEPMERHTTFRIGGPARRMAMPTTVAEAAALLDMAEAAGWPVLVVGSGSNLLAADQGLDRLVVMTGGIDHVEISGQRIRAGAGARLARVAVAAMEHGLEGLAFAHGIPGSVGGAVFMNAGAYGGEMVQVVESVNAWLPGKGLTAIAREELDMGYRRSRFSGGSGVVLEAFLSLRPGDRESIRGEMAGDELDFSYRHSAFSDRRGCVTQVTIRLAPGDREEILARMKEIGARRTEKQPLDYPSAGSTFKRPAQGYASALIDQCGLKGRQVGGAQVSEKHAGFIINRGGATCADVLELMAQVREEVFRQKQVRLEPEVKVLR